LTCNFEAAVGITCIEGSVFK